MLDLLFSQLAFFFSIIFILFLPGWFLLLAVFGKENETLSGIERFVLSFGLGLVILDFLSFFLSGLRIKIGAESLILTNLIFLLFCFAVFILKKSKQEFAFEKKDLFNFSGIRLVVLLALVFLGVFLRSGYLSGTVAPTATDMGHHMYWAKEMALTGELPTYNGMPDFIIGEHIVFGAFEILTGLGFFSAFPPMLLFLFNLVSILTVFVLVVRIFGNRDIGLLALFFLGALFAVSSPQAKFISGGVVGNIMGNLLIPLALYFYFRALAFLSDPQKKPEEAHRKFLALAVFSTFGLFYTHHLSAFIFLFVSFFSVAIFFLVNVKNIAEIFGKIFRLVFSPATLGVFLGGLIFFFFVFTPTYFENSAVETAVGSPSKSTREGLSFSDMRSSVGEARLALGILGFLILAFSLKKRNFGHALVLGWTAALLLMSMKPGWLFIDLPSSRIGNYASYPLAVLGAFSVWFLIQKFKIEKPKENLLFRRIFPAFFILLFSFVAVSGFSDFSSSIKNKNDVQEMVQIFHASGYLAEKTSPEDVLLKDHNYLSGTAWMKLFFMRGYRYPESRGLLRRYDDPVKPREMCTLHMISSPGSEEAKECFSQSGTNFITVNPLYDSAQFQKLKNFDRVYDNGYAVSFHRK